MDARLLVPTDEDLPGTGWRTVGEASGPDPITADPGAWAGLAGLPADDDVVDTAASPHFLLAPHRLVHGIAAVLRTPGAADRARTALAGADFARHLGLGLAADLGQGAPETEVLAVDVEPSDVGHRVVFTGVGPAGVVPVHLDVVALGAGLGVSVVWFADAPTAFPAEDRDHVLVRLAHRVGGGGDEGRPAPTARPGP